MFDREKAVLQIGLFEMRGLVETLVVVEANVTQAGYPRQILGADYFAGLRLDPLYPKILHQPFRETACGRRCYPLKLGSHELGREAAIRNTALTAGWARAGARPHDIGAIGDVDEVPVWAAQVRVEH
eukprot:TRINITY_DN14332_c0_g1_i8.p1 TRINITY_DN14332_c0_g1~~TRINITY_DN14332_c0_g1_i8.p1  ORF type:complete len:127 (+),score=20.94 TRINITY_DN14332_c0_g1_i8:349-729(+)